MTKQELLAVLEKQLAKAESLAHPPAYNPDYKLWHTKNRTVIKAELGEALFDVYESGQRHIMTRTESHMYQNYLYNLDRLRQNLTTIVGEIKETLEGEPNLVTSTIPFETYDFHPKIKAVSQSLFEKQEYPSAVLEAFKEVINEVKRVTGLDDKSADSIMNKSFNVMSPLIKLNPLSNDSERDEQSGFMYLFKGIVGVRNYKGHEHVELSDPKKAIEYLALASLLMRRLDERIA